jgi:hypothetical protein
VTPLSLQFNNIKNGDTADWHGNAPDGALHYLNSIDAFGNGVPGVKQIVTATDLQVMDVLGWTPTAPTTVTAMTALNEHHLLV